MAVRNFRTGYVYGSRPSRDSKQSNESYSVFDEDDPFWDDYNNLSEEYRNQLDPYLKYNYQLGAWDKFGNWLGINTAEDKYRMQMQDRARLALSGLQSDVFQNTYDSAQQQASRERDAGLNPDLAGEVSGVPASGLEQPLSPIDPQIFNPPVELIPDIAAFFGSAATGLQSVATFGKLLADITKTKHEGVNVELSSWDKALSTALDYVSARDPELERQALSDDPEVDVNSQDFFNQSIIPSRVEAVDQRFSHLSPKAREMMKKAVDVQSKNPLAFDNYYKNAKSAQENRTDYLASKEVHGSLFLLDEVVSKTNEIMLKQRMYAIRSQVKLNAIISAYNTAKAENDWDFEVFKQQYHLPETLVESQFADYVATTAKSQADASIERMRLDFINYLKQLSDDKDPAAQYILQGVLTKMGYAPLMQNSINGQIGAKMFGVSGGATWNNYLIPGQSEGLHLFPAME